MTSPLSITTFRSHEELWPSVPAPVRQRAFYTLSEREQASCWAALGDSCRREVEEALAYERALGEEPPSRHQPAQRSQAATSTSAGSVALDSGDPLKQIPPSEYVEALTGEPVPPGGFILCP